MFLWNPYKKSDDLKTTTETTTNLDSTLQSPEPVASALSVQTSTLSTLLNTSAVLISAASILGTIASGVNDNSMPKVSAYKQKRSSEKGVEYHGNPKHPFSPFFLPTIYDSDSSTKRKIVFDTPIKESVNENSGTKLIQNGVKEQKRPRRKIKTSSFVDEKTKAPNNKYKTHGERFRLEDPFTTYVKGIFTV